MIPDLVAHLDKSPSMYQVVDQPLMTIACDTCAGRWPCSQYAWSRFADPEDVQSNCNRCNDGVVSWTGEGWCR